MALLPLYPSTDRVISMLQTQWSALLNPLLTAPNSNTLTSIPLTTGVNSINHKLGRALRGWTIIRQRALASIYDSQDSNPTPDTTLLLVSSAPVTIDIEVF